MRQLVCTFHGLKPALLRPSIMSWMLFGTGYGLSARAPAYTETVWKSATSLSVTFARAAWWRCRRALIASAAMFFT